MKISVNDELLFELTTIQKQVIMNDIDENIFDEDMKRRLFYIINHKYEQCFKKLKAEWEPKLAANGIKSIPTDKDEFAALVFTQSNYKNKHARSIEDTNI